MADFKLIHARCNAPVALPLVFEVHFTQTLRLALELACEAGTLPRIFVKE